MHPTVYCYIGMLYTIQDYYDYIVYAISYRIGWNDAKVQFFHDFKLKDTQSLAKHFIRFGKRLQMVSQNIIMQRLWGMTVEKREFIKRCVSYLYSTCLK